MARVMTLDGLEQARVAEIRARLDGADLDWWQTPLGGLFDPVRAFPLWAVAGLLVGAWLAGSKTGRSLVGR